MSQCDAVNDFIMNVNHNVLYFKVSDFASYLEECFTDAHLTVGL